MELEMMGRGRISRARFPKSRDGGKEINRRSGLNSI